MERLSGGRIKGEVFVVPGRESLMEISDQLLCLFSAEIKQQNGKYVIEVPQQELRQGQLTEGQIPRVAILSGVSDSTNSVEKRQPDREPDTTATSSPDHGGQPTPPVDEGEVRRVEIEDIGDQGDGITRVERGFIVIVPDTETGERVEVEITDVRENVAFADVVERLSYYD